MLNHTKLSLISLVSYISKYPIHLLENGKLAELPLLLPLTSDEPRITPFYGDPALLSSLLAQASPEPAIISESTYIHYGIMETDADLVCILGPIASASIHSDEIRDYYHRHHIPGSQNAYLPKASANKTLAMLSLVRFCLTNTYEAPQKLQKSISTALQTSEFQLLNYRLKNAESDIQHIPYIVEKRLTSAISHGNIDELKKLMKYDSGDYSLGTLASTSDKQLEYQAVVSISLFARAAIEGGVNPYEAYDQNDLYLQRLSRASGADEYQHITVEALTTYCLMVKRAQEQESPSMHITKCKHFIAGHLNRHFNMQEIADYVGLSPKYLGDLFHRLEGQTLKSYILQSRIDAAKNMLKYSDFSISRIANYFCFDSQSHFGATFRKFEGISPSEYRKRNKPVNF